MRKFKSKFGNMEELYTSSGYFWQYGMYLDHIRIIKTGDKPYLLNKNTNEIIKHLKNINKYMILNDLQVEE